MGTIRTVVANWVRQPDLQSISISIQEGSRVKWEEFGYLGGETTVGADFWIFSGEATVRGQHKTYKLDLRNEDHGIDIVLRADGIKSFKIASSPEWWVHALLKLLIICALTGLLGDVPGIKRALPDLLDGKPDPLDPDLVRITDVLVGYNVSLTVKFSDQYAQTMKEYMSEIYEGHGSVTIFGFKLDANDFVKTHRHSYDQHYWNAEESEMNIRGSKNGEAVVLGMLGKKVGPGVPV
jgi:hypothetical protein